MRLHSTWQSLEKIEYFRIVTFQTLKRRKIEKWIEHHIHAHGVQTRDEIFCSEPLESILQQNVALSICCNCYSFWPLAVRTQAVTILEQERDHIISYTHTQETITNHFGYETVINMSKMCQSYFPFVSHSQMLSASLIVVVVVSVYILCCVFFFCCLCGPL